MSQQDVLLKIQTAVAEGEEEAAVELVKEALSQSIPPLVILNDGAAKGMDIIGERYNEGEAYLPDLVIAGDAMTAILDLIFSNMSAEEKSSSKLGVVVMGQAQGDVHDIGKNIVSALLSVNGFEVHDLGTDVTVKQLVEKSKEVNADIIGVSTLLTTSLPYLSDLVRYLNDTGMRERVNVIFGGGPVTPEFTQSAGGDG